MDKDIFDKIISRLKQKAKTGAFIMILVAHNREEKEKRWVRLEDALETLKELKQRQKQILFNKCKQEWEICHKECDEIECIIKELYFEFFGESIKELLKE